MIKQIIAEFITADGLVSNDIVIEFPPTEVYYRPVRPSFKSFDVLDSDISVSPAFDRREYRLEHIIFKRQRPHKAIYREIV